MRNRKRQLMISNKNQLFFLKLTCIKLNRKWKNKSQVSFKKNILNQF